MKQERDEVPVACALSNAEFRQRKTTLFAQFNSAVISTRELPNGYEFQIPGDANAIAIVAELIAAEHECCPFLRFELIAEPSNGPVTLRVTGSSGAKDIWIKALCED